MEDHHRIIVHGCKNRAQITRPTGLPARRRTEHRRQPGCCLAQVDRQLPHVEVGVLDQAALIVASATSTASRKPVACLLGSVRQSARSPLPAEAHARSAAAWRCSRGFQISPRRMAPAANAAASSSTRAVVSTSPPARSGGATAAAAGGSCPDWVIVLGILARRLPSPVGPIANRLLTPAAGQGCKSGLAAAVWLLPCESPVQRFRSPGQSLRTAADL
jgi:hypothetical protein